MSIIVGLPPRRDPGRLCFRALAGFLTSGEEAAVFPSSVMTSSCHLPPRGKAPAFFRLSTGPPGRRPLRCVSGRRGAGVFLSGVPPRGQGRRRGLRPLVRPGDRSPGGSEEKLSCIEKKRSSVTVPSRCFPILSVSLSESHRQIRYIRGSRPGRCTKGGNSRRRRGPRWACSRSRRPSRPASALRGGFPERGPNR